MSKVIDEDMSSKNVYSSEQLLETIEEIAGCAVAAVITYMVSSFLGKKLLTNSYEAHQS